MELEELRAIVRPEGVHTGVMTTNTEICTGCGLCVQNCPFKCWEMDENLRPRLREDYKCFSCYNCVIACPVGGVSIGEPYHVDGGFWASEPHPLPAKMPLEPKDADGNPTEWNAMERAILERRSARNFTDRPVPDHLIRRVLEAGRFAPSAGNSQPWQFIVITDKDLIRKMSDAARAGATAMYHMYNDDENLEKLAGMAEASPGGLDPRIAQGGLRAVASGDMAPSLNAPCVILIAADSRAIGGPIMSVGICGQNMSLVANSLGIKSCWVGFLVGGVAAIKDKLDLKPNWSVVTTLVLGWPAFKQEGMVPREYRPVRWLREGATEAEIEE